MTGLVDFFQVVFSKKVLEFVSAFGRSISKVAGTVAGVCDMVEVTGQDGFRRNSSVMDGSNFIVPDVVVGGVEVGVDEVKLVAMVSFLR